MTIISARALLSSIPQGRDILDDVRVGYTFVASRAAHVKINHHALQAYAATLKPVAQAQIFDLNHHYCGDAESTAAYVLTLDALNYGSGFFKSLMNDGWCLVDGEGYFTLSTNLKRYFEANGPIPAAALVAITPSDVADILKFPKTPTAERLANSYAEGLRDLGFLIHTRYDGSFYRLVESADGSVGALVSALAALPQFHDIHEYQGRKISFLKRAQSTAADMNDAFGHLGVDLFSDIAELTVLTDNGVPRVLRADGILDYAPDLATLIVAGEKLPSGSIYEVEIRGCTGQAVEELARLSGLSPMTLDRILWHRHAGDSRYDAAPTHRTESTFY